MLPKYSAGRWDNRPILVRVGGSERRRSVRYVLDQFLRVYIQGLGELIQRVERDVSLRGFLVDALDRGQVHIRQPRELALRNTFASGYFFHTQPDHPGLPF